MIAKLLGGGLIGLCAGIGLVTSTNRWEHSLPDGSTGDRLLIQDAIREGVPGEQFHEWVIVYIGSSTCNQSRNPDLPNILAGIRSTLEREIADRFENTFVSAVGVDLNPLLGQELHHLQWVGAFEQMSLGGSYLNWLASHVSWSPFDGAPGVPTPQVVVLKRSFERLNERGTGMHVAMVDELLVGRRYGVDRLESWDIAEMVALQQ